MDAEKLWDRYMNVISIIDNEDSYVIVEFAGNEILEWSDICECPEDMIWYRDIGRLAIKFFNAGVRAAEMEREETDGR